MFLSRDDSGSYSLHYLKPTWARIFGTKKFAWYPVVGEPVSWRNMCAAVTHQLLGGTYEMQAGAEPVEVDVTIAIKEATL